MARLAGKGGKWRGFRVKLALDGKLSPGHIARQALSGSGLVSAPASPHWYLDCRGQADLPGPA